MDRERRLPRTGLNCLAIDRRLDPFDRDVLVCCDRSNRKHNSTA
jgi:hypothetical protein